MSPSTKDKIREDVQDAMADKEEGELQKWSYRMIYFNGEREKPILKCQRKKIA